MMDDNFAIKIAMHEHDAYKCFTKYYIDKGYGEEDAKLKANQLIEEAYAHIQMRLDQEMKPRKHRGT